MAARLRLAIMNSEGFGCAARMTSGLALLRGLQPVWGAKEFCNQAQPHYNRLVGYCDFNQTLTPAASCTLSCAGTQSARYESCIMLDLSASLLFHRHVHVCFSGNMDAPRPCRAFERLCHHL